MTSGLGRNSVLERSRIILFLLLIGAAALATTTGAQENTIENAALRIAQHLRSEKVVVLDVVGPGAELTPIGTNLADHVSTTLAKTDPKLRVEERSNIDVRIQKAGFTTEALVDSHSLLDVARSLKADVAVTGTLAAGADGLKIDLTVKRVKSGQTIDSEQATIPAPENRKLMQPYFESALGSAPESGKNGYSYPRCVSCPQAAYTQDALDAKITGATVILAALVTPDARANDMAVIKKAPEGLTESALNAVQRWRFAPATGPDSKPVAVRQIIEVTFHLY